MKTRIVVCSMGLAFLCLACGESSQGIRPSHNFKVEVAHRNSLDDNSKATTSLSLGLEGSYIVELNDPAVASYNGNIKGFSATSPAAKGLLRLDVNAEESRVYSAMLVEKQDLLLDKFSQTLGRQIQVSQRYQHTLNGFALTLNAQELNKLQGMPEVKRITKDVVKQPVTDVGPQWIGVEAFWEADESASPPELSTKGEGVVIAIIDNGINNLHPSFADAGDDGYDHSNPLGSGNYIPGSYCDTVDPEFCNDKIIGAWALAPVDFDPQTPLDSTGHGSHTASIAAGNLTKFALIEAPTTSFIRQISGVAPHANIIVYDACHSIGCPTSSLLAAVEQVVIDASALPDGIQAMNLSIGIDNVGSPYSDPIAQGFLNATTAGIYVSTAAGNTGPSPSTLFNTSPWVATVAATTHNRKLTNNLVNVRSERSTFGDIPAQGFTTGYGPAPIIYAGHFPTGNGSANDESPGLCSEPFPPGHFDGEIVICDRGGVALARVDKGANVMAGGAGGLVLVNSDAFGELINSDSHVLPGLHIGFEDGQALKRWLSCQASAVAKISGVVVEESPENGDIMGDFSSRGPLLEYDLLKPDIAAPGVNVLAAVGGYEQPQSLMYDFISGTSMSAPHHAAAAALLSSIRPSWTPHEIKSALMMTANNAELLKDDGLTPADPFDVGSGRMSLNRIQQVDLVLNETPDNFIASNPELGGDPSSLNLASMQSSHCVEKCSWQRRLKNVGDEESRHELKIISPEGVSLRVSPDTLKLAPGEEAEITVEADTVFASSEWGFATLQLLPESDSKPTLQMPIALKPSLSSNSGFIEISVDEGTVNPGDTVSYQISLSNGQVAGPISLEAELPDGFQLLENSLNQDVVSGSSDVDFRERNGKLFWEGELQVSSIDIRPEVSPLNSSQYFSISSFTEPSECPEDCDEGALTLNVPEFTFHGKKYTQVIWSVNGTIQAGAEGVASSFNPSQFPSEEGPNNLMAPFWTDLSLSRGDAEWYTNVVTNGANEFIVFEWKSVSRFADPDALYNFQVWIEVGDSGNIWYVYGDMSENVGDFVSIGAQVDDGAVGYSYYFNGEGTVPVSADSLGLFATAGGSAEFCFTGEIVSCPDQATIARVQLDTSEGGESAFAAARCAP